MRFTPKTEKEIVEERLWPEGEYDFSVSQAVEATSKAGNEMIKAFVTVYRPDGKVMELTDYLMESMLWKLLHFCEATGLSDLYHSGQIVGDGMGEIVEFKGKEGRLKLGIQKSDDYPDKNVIKDYISSDDAAPRPKKAKVTNEQVQKPLDDLEDEIPF